MMIITIIIDIRIGNIFMMNNLKDVNIVTKTMLMLMILSKAKQLVNMVMMTTKTTESVSKIC